MILLGGSHLVISPFFRLLYQVLSYELSSALNSLFKVMVMVDN